MMRVGFTWTSGAAPASTGQSFYQYGGAGVRQYHSPEEKKWIRTVIRRLVTLLAPQRTRWA